MKTNDTPRLVLSRETLRKLDVAEKPVDERAFLIYTKFSCYSPISCPVPCA